MGIFKNDDKQSSAFGFDEKSMAGKAVKAVRWIYAITGVLALVAGIALLFAPAKSLVFLTTVLGFYFIITAAIRLFTAIFEPLLPAGWRVTSIISNLLIILGGVIILRNQAFSTATLTTLVVVVAGFGWIVEGVMSILESELSSNRALAILSGALSIIAGMFVFIYPLWSAKMLVIFSGAALLVFGVVIAGNSTQNLERHIRRDDPRDAEHARRGFWVTTLDVSVGADSADFAIIERLQAGDVVVTQDIGLASMVLGRDAAAIGVRGRVYDKATIDMQLFIRHEEKKVRRAGGRTRGPAAFTSEDRARFKRNLTELLR